MTAPLIAPSPVPPAAPEKPIPLWRAGAVVAVALVTLLLCHLAPPPVGSTEAGVTLTLPYRLGDWWGIDTPISVAEKTLLPTDTEFARKSYQSSQGDNILCSIVLSGAERRSIHRPEFCLPAQGWRIRGGQVVDVTLHAGGTLKVMNLSLTRSIRGANGKEAELSSYYMYWFVGNQVTTPYHWERLWWTSWDRVFHNVNHRWAYVIVTSPVTEGFASRGKNPDETLAMLKAFIADVAPSFQKDLQAETAPASP